MSPSSIQFTIIDHHPQLLDACRAAFASHLSPAVQARFTIVQTELAKLEGTYDCIVSPANSYGLMDGGLDYWISELICASDMTATTHAVQAHLYARYRGYMSPGQCALVPLPEALRGPSNKENTKAFKYVAVCPTMRVPENISWNKDIVYECMWNLLLALDQHNTAASEGEEVRTVVMSGFGTGAGFISAKKCAEQMALAIKHYRMAVEEEGKWSKLSWKTVREVGREIDESRKVK